LEYSLMNFMTSEVSLQQETESILAVNEETKPYGMVLSVEEAQELARTRRESLSRSGRIEIGTDTIRKLTKAFGPSRYVTQENLASVLCEAAEAFYELKNESEDRISDEELALLLADGFERFGGNLSEFLRSRELNRLLRIRRYGYAEEDDTADDEEADDDD
jgi:hypothetical protein